MTNAGIDYGHGTTNHDTKTGIRYGVISQNSVMLEYTDLEYDYGKPTCPKCGNEVTDAAAANASDESWSQYHEHGCKDYACETCEHYLDSQDCFGDEPIGWSYEGDGYQLTDCLDNAIFVINSPFYTFTQFCSPCVPGAGNLDSPVDEGAKTFALGHDWFESGCAPYPLYSVATGELVPASTEAPKGWDKVDTSHD